MRRMCVAGLIIVAALVLATPVNAEPLPWSPAGIEDVSYAGTSRLVYRIQLEVDDLPEADPVEETAVQVWERLGGSYAEFTVFAYLPGMDTGNAAYAVAGFTREGLDEFRVQEYAAIGTKWWPAIEARQEQSSTPTPEGATGYHMQVDLTLGDSRKLHVDVQTDLPDGTSLMIGVSRRYWEKGNSDTYAGDIWTEDYPVVDGEVHADILVSDTKWYAERKQKEREFAGLGIFGTIGTISPDVTVRVLFSPRRNQSPETLSVLGKDGELLSGEGVSRSGNIFVFEVEKEIGVPFIK